jgi:hypothetical protein
LLDEGFEVAADFGAVFGAGEGGLGDGDNAYLTICGGRQGGEGLGVVGGAQLHLLTSEGETRANNYAYLRIFMRSLLPAH